MLLMAPEKISKKEDRKPRTVDFTDRTLAALDKIAHELDTKKFVLVSKVIEWFAAQHPTTQRLILGHFNYDSDMQKKALELMVDRFNSQTADSGTVKREVKESVAKKLSTLAPSAPQAHLPRQPSPADGA